jgi:hypothetical protein
MKLGKVPSDLYIQQAVEILAALRKLGEQVDHSLLKEKEIFIQIIKNKILTNELKFSLSLSLSLSLSMCSVVLFFCV